jgi:4-carboxymuconolactone decarboxylase
MARFQGVSHPRNWPGEMDEATKKGFDELFGFVSDEEFTGRHFGYAVPTAQSPWFALHVAKLTTYVVRDMAWPKRVDLRELAIQTVNLHFKCGFNYLSHVGYAENSGITPAMQTAIPLWRTSDLFDEEQRLVIEFTYATASGDVSDDLFARVRGKWGEKGAIEFTAVIATFGFWAMLVNVAAPRTPENP